MSGSAPRPFAFDTVFDEDGKAHALPRPKRLYPADEVEQIRNAARAEGEQIALSSIEAETARALAQIAAACEAALPRLAEVAHDHRTGSADLAFACGRAIADAALERFPEAPARAALESLAREVESAPRLVVTAPAELAEKILAALEETAQAIGYPGAIQVRAGGAGGAAFTLDFGDGQAAFDPEAAANRVRAALAAALAAEGLHAEPLIPSGS